MAGAWHRVVQGDQLGAVRERSLHLDFLEHFRDSVHQLLTPQDGATGSHELAHGPAVAGALHHEARK